MNQKLKKIIILILICLSLGLISGCENDEEAPDIYASIYPIEFIVKNIVGEELTVKSVYPRGRDVHDYEPKPKDIIRMSNSKLIFYIGLGLEPVIEQSRTSTLKNIPTVALSDGMELVEINADDHEEHNHNHGDNDTVFYDPHIWLDLEKMQIMAEKILETIIATFTLTSEQIDRFTLNTLELNRKFQELDNEYFSVINDKQYLNKTILVDHDAYAYWEVRYGIKRIRIRNDNDSTDIIAKEMQEKVNLAKQNKIKYICLTKNEIESSIVNQYLSLLGLNESAKVYLHHLATITDEEEKAGNDYLSIMRDNLKLIEKVLPR